MAERMLTPSKITAFLDCDHYLTLQHQLDAGELTIRTAVGSMARMLMDKGLVHEQACLSHYRQSGLSIFEVATKNRGETFSDWIHRVGNPMAAGHDVIYQMPFMHQGIRGVADFLVRVPREDGTFGYEPVDAKLARTEAKPGHILQLCFYADAIEALTAKTPKYLQIWLGSGRIETIRLNDVRAYWRRLRLQLRKVMSADLGARISVPEPCTHCDFCEFADTCEAEWRQKDSLVFVANTLRNEREAMVMDGVPTLAALAEHTGEIAGLRPERLTQHVKQAALQVQARQEPTLPAPFQLLPFPQDGVLEGMLALPAPDNGDIFLDFEGHPFWTAERGLFFLFGLLTRAEDGSWTYEARWSHDRADEHRATRQLITDLAERRIRYPDMHVYHYNHTERSVLERLAEEYGTGVEALHALVRSGMFIDLLAVVKKALQAGVESYGLKHIEKLAGFTRSPGIEQGSGAVTEYDAFCLDAEPARLIRIARYNQDDVLATQALRDWLLQLRPTHLAWRPSTFEPVVKPDSEIPAQIAALHTFPNDTAEHLLGDLLGHWTRESRAVFADSIAKTQYDLPAQFKHPEIIAGLEPWRPVIRSKNNGGLRKDQGYEFRIPSQTIGSKLSEGGAVVYPGPNGMIVFSQIDEIDASEGVLRLAWSEKCQALDHFPEVIVLNTWVRPDPKPAALSALAAKVISGSITDPPSPVAMAILRRSVPVFHLGHGPAADGFSDDLEEMREWVLHLDHSFVAIQGPPGTGKTYTGAHLIHALVMAGKRVGVTAMSHFAIDNLISKVIEVFEEAGDEQFLRAICKVNDAHTRPHDSVTYTAGIPPCTRANFNVVSGTTWLFADARMRSSPVDVLFIDEAGQLALADAVAAVGSAKNVVLLGDPQQLAHVSQGCHPGRAGVSVLEHLLGPDQATITPDQGVFLRRSWRMHPDVCGFISDQFYDGQLISHPSCSLQATQVGTGLRWIPAEHTDCSTEAPAEAKILLAAIINLLGKEWTDAEGATRPLTAHDVLVVAPYNDQVAVVQRHLKRNPLTAAVRIGTVDKFQGQEAPVVFFTMTASSSNEVPRGLSFLFSKNRLNVAISRARGLAHIVCTDALLNSRAKDVEEMELISTLCAFAESCQQT